MKRNSLVVVTAFGAVLAVVLSFGVQGTPGWSAGAATTPDIGPRTSTAAKALLTGVKEVRSNPTSSCALLRSGGIDCWGQNADGELGNGTHTDSAVPVPVTGITTAVALSGDWRDYCAVLSGGGVECWGSNLFGQLGNGTRGTVLNSDVPVAATGITDAASITSDSNGAYCIVRSTHGIACWGNDAYGQLGDGNSTTDTGAPVPVTGIAQAKSVTGYAASFCAVLTTGMIRCWGTNTYGQLGNGSTMESDVPVAVKNITNAVSAVPDIYNGNNDGTYCALLSTATVKCWGFGFYGQLGNGIFYNKTSPYASDVPVTVKGVANATQLMGGGDSFCALRSSAHVACWGYNVDGELGNGTFTDSAVPVSVKTISNAIGLSGGIFSQCATRSTGKIACWGNNVEGELGNGTLTNAKVPVAVKNIANASSVEGNAEYDNCALLTTSGVDCWGNGQYGQLGNGIFYNTTIYVSEVPVAVLAAA